MTSLTSGRIHPLNPQNSAQRRKKIFLNSGLLFVGLLLAVTMLGNLKRDFAPYFWKKTGCVIRKAEIVKPEPDSLLYNFSVSYDYEFEGNRFNNSTWRRTDPGPYDSYSALTDRVGKYMLDSSSSCYVNPRDPTQVVLARENPLRILFLLIPVLVMVPAARALIFPDRPLIPLRAALQLVAFGVVAFGFFLFWIFFGQSMFDLIRSRAWKPSTCTVITSYMYTGPSSNTTGSSTRTRGHRLRILFSYVYGGKEFRADRYDFIRWGSGGTRLTPILNRYPADAQIECYVNPTKPYEAVINRTLSMRNFLGLLPLLIALAGVVLLMVAKRAPLSAASP